MFNIASILSFDTVLFLQISVKYAQERYTPLTSAAAQGHTASAKLLIDWGADIHGFDKASNAMSCNHRIIILLQLNPVIVVIIHVIVND
jgi:hypothetical protein